MSAQRGSVTTGLIAGLAGGLIGAWTMNQFQAAWAKASEFVKSEREDQQSRKQHHDSQQSQQDSEDATMKAADKLAQAVLGRGLSRDEKEKAGPIVHYAFGSAVGAVYGLAAALEPEATRGFGTLFGATLFAVADEIAVPALGLSRNPTEYP